MKYTLLSTIINMRSELNFKVVSEKFNIPLIPQNSGNQLRIKARGQQVVRMEVQLEFVLVEIVCRSQKCITNCRHHHHHHHQFMILASLTRSIQTFEQMVAS
jgi:hypothetical protein